MILINGQPTGQIDARDRGLHYGDGLFETIAVRDGRPQLWDRHLARLTAGCERLRLPAPDAALLAAEAAQLCDGVAQGVLKIILTRGVGGRGYAIPHADAATAAGRMSRILIRLPAPDYPATHYRDGVAVRLCELRLGDAPALAGIKHLNRLEQVLARSEWSDPGIAEGLMRDAEGAVIEGTMSNLFIVRTGGLETPELTRCGVAGVMRGRIIDRARELGLAVTERRLMPADLAAADECFLCNSLIGIWPVRRIDDNVLPVGPLTRWLTEQL